MRVTMRTGSSKVNYLLGDHLGSTAITTNSSGVKSAEIRYFPWGTTRYTSGTTPTTFRFTGQRLESGIGLYFYNTRWYDAAAGRFAQGDTIIPGAGNPQAWDRYAYTNNNPVRYTDPTGHRNCEEDDYNCPGGRPPALTLTVSLATTQEIYYTDTYNTTMTTTSSGSILPQRNIPDFSGSYTGHVSIGMNRIKEVDLYDVTDARYRLPGIESRFNNPIDVFNYLLGPFATSAFAKSAESNVGITLNYDLYYGNPTEIGVSSIGISNSSGLPVTVNTVNIVGSTRDYRYVGQTSSSNYNSYPINISVESFLYVDISVSLYSSYDYDDVFSGFRFMNTRIWNNSTAENLAR